MSHRVGDGAVTVVNVAGLVGTAYPEPFGPELASEEVFHRRMPAWFDEQAPAGSSTPSCSTRRRT